MDFYIIGELYKFNQWGKALVLKAPYIMHDDRIFVEKDGIFTVLEKRYRISNTNDLFMSHDINDKHGHVWQIKILIDNQIGYICFYPESDLGKFPNKYFSRVMETTENS